MQKKRDSRSAVFIRFQPLFDVVTHSNLSDRRVSGDRPFKFLPHQLSMVVYWTTMAFTGNGGLGFDSGEGA